MTKRKYGVDLDEYDNEVYEMGKELTEEEDLAARPITDKDIKFVLDVIKKEAPYDEISIKQLFYGMASGFTRSPLPHNVNSRQAGSGKSYDLELVAGYVPSQYVQRLGGISDKALFHQNGVMVIENDSTGETELADPILERLETELEEIEDDLEDAKESKDKAKRKELKRRFREVQKELDETKQKMQKLIILDNKILLVLDTARDTFFNALMSLVSQDTQEDQKYVFAEQTGGRKFVARVNRLRGMPVIFTTQVIDDTKQQRFAEKNRRFVNVNPDTSAKKIMTAKNLIGLKSGMLPEELDAMVVSKADKEKAKTICSYAVKKLIKHSQFFAPKETGVKIAFAPSIAYGLPGDPMDVWGMTVMDRLMRYLAIITKLRMDSRPRLIDLEEPEKFYPVAIFEDLREALQLMGRASSALRPYIANWYNKVCLPLYRRAKNAGIKCNQTDSGKLVESEDGIGLTSKELAEETQRVFGGIKPSRDDIRDNYLEPLCRLGIMDKFQSVLNKKENLYLPVDEVGTSNIFSMSTNENDPDDFRLEIKEPFFYPCKTLLLDYCRTVIKRRQESLTSTTDFHFFKKYRIEDSKGVELTPNELIDQYLSNPEICFKKGFDEAAYIRPVLNNLFYDKTVKNKNSLWMYDSSGVILREFPNNSIEDSSMNDREDKDENPPPWARTDRGMTEEEAKDYETKVTNLGKLADTDKANLSGNGVLKNLNEKPRNDS